MPSTKNKVYIPFYKEENIKHIVFNIKRNKESVLSNGNQLDIFNNEQMEILNKANNNEDYDIIVQIYVDINLYNTNIINVIKIVYGKNDIKEINEINEENKNIIKDNIIKIACETQNIILLKNLHLKTDFQEKEELINKFKSNGVDEKIINEILTQTCECNGRCCFGIKLMSFILLVVGLTLYYI